MLDYAANKQVCRSKMILEYFGEEAHRCGTCDICLELNKMNISELRFEQLLNQIKEQLILKPATLANLTAIITLYSKEQITGMVKWLIDNGQVVYNEQNELLWLH
jgi:ATP-dependent DNA helicase RecQ